MTRTVLITGVRGGVGRATAELFRSEGWTTAGIDRVENGEKPELDGYLHLDLSRADVAEELTAFIEGLQRLDALVNNAALQVEKGLLDTDVGEWDQVLATNLRAAFLATKAAYPQLRMSQGAIVNVSSVHAVATSAGVAAYATSKGGLAALTRAAAIELAPSVRVNAVLPGAVDTPMLRSGLARFGTSDGAIDAALQAIAGRTPLARVAEPAEIAQGILFLADNHRSSFVTGQTLIVDGGATARLATE